jgi:sugar phosphate isomerase/epimerase
MEFPWTKHFSLGIVVPAFFRDIRLRKGPILEVMHRAASDPFFQALEFSGAEDPAIRKELAGMVRACGKSLIFSGGSYCYANQNNLHDLDEGRRKAAVENLRRIVDEAVEYGCRVLYVMGFEAPADRRAGLQKFRTSLAELSAHARGVNPSAPLTLSVENFHIFIRDPFLIGPTLETAEMLRDLRRDHPNLGLTFDTSHILQLQEDLPSTYRSVRDVIAHVHLSNCLLRDRSSPFYGDKHPPYGLPGSEIGIAELAAFLKVLKDAGHFERAFPTGKPVLSLEIITPSNQNPEKTLAEAKETFLCAWKEFEKAERRGQRAEGIASSRKN